MVKLLTPEMAAEQVHVKVSTVKHWLRDGQLEGVKVGRQWRVREEDLEAFIEKSTREGKEVE